MPAYPHIIAAHFFGGIVSAEQEDAANCPLLRVWVFEAAFIAMQNIAMQKVVGSNPISRFARDLALGRDFVVQAGIREIKPSRISPISCDFGLSGLALVLQTR